MKVDSIITLEKGELNRRQWEKLFRKLTYTDADEVEIMAFDYVSGKDIVRVPRGAWSLLPAKLDAVDMRCRPVMPKYRYVKELDAPDYAGQIAAVRAMFEHQQGQIIAPPGRGKTEMVLAFAAACRTRTLVVVHTGDLFKQWVDRAEESVPGMPVGKIRGSECQVEHLTIATAQTLKRYISAGGKFWRQFGCIVIDEAHHAAADTWEWLLNSCPAYYRFGVTASERRSDGRQPSVKFNIGPVIYKLKFKSAVPMRVVPVKSDFRSKYNATMWTKLVAQLVRDEKRNTLIAGLTQRLINKGNTVLVLSRQITHLERIYDALDDKTHARIVTGRLPRRQRDDLIAKLRSGEIRCILGTQLFEEGVDIPRLSRIVLAFPGTEITALQKVGRGARKFEGKSEALVYDIVDHLVPVLGRQYVQRRAWYRRNGIKVRKAVDYATEKKERRKLRDRLKVARSRGA